MKAKIFCALIAVTCLNSIDILNDNMILPKDNITRLRNIQGYSGIDNIVPRSNRWGSIAWRGLGVGTIVGGIGSMECNGNGLGLLIPSLLSFEFSYTYWFNNRVGFVGRAILCGDAYASFIDDDNPAVAILQLGGGVRWSYNGRGGRSNGTYYGGNVMANLMGGSFTDISDIDFKIDLDIGQVGVNISVVPFEWVNTKNFFLKIGTTFDIGSLSTNDVREALLGVAVSNIKLSLGKNFYF